MGSGLDHACPLSLQEAAERTARRPDMLSWAFTLLIAAAVAGLLGFTGIAGFAAGLAQILFFIFLTLFVIALIPELGRNAD
jgi:uncharacterized membrane protein YtjA (UPF0391 family)